jgi:hypothetical protein
MPWIILTLPFIKLFGLITNKREVKRNNVGLDNQDIVAPINSIDMLLGRTIIVSAHKN